MKISYEITENVARVEESDSKWHIEVNYVSWNNREPKIDIRKWSDDHTEMGKGFTLSSAELEGLYRALGRYYGSDTSVNEVNHAVESANDFNKFVEDNRLENMNSSTALNTVISKSDNSDSDIELPFD